MFLSCVGQLEVRFTHLFCVLQKQRNQLMINQSIIRHILLTAVGVCCVNMQHMSRVASVEVISGVQQCAGFN